MGKFQVELSRRAQRDLDGLTDKVLAEISKEILSLEANPFPHKKRIKKIKGSTQPLYRLRIDASDDSYRVFYTIQKPDLVLILRVVSKKQSDRVLRRLR